jgi:hypothetical protein
MSEHLFRKMLGRLSERCFGKLLLTQACIEIFSGKLLIEKPSFYAEQYFPG